MTNFVLIPRNLFDEAYELDSSPAMLSTKPVENLQKQDRGNTARSSSLAAQSIICLLSEASRVSGVSVGRHNLQAAGTITVQAYSDLAMSSSVEDSGALASFTTGSLSRIDQAKYLTDRYRGLKNFAYYFAAVRTNVRAVKITFNDASNPDGFLECARVSIGEVFEAGYNPPLAGGLQMGVETSTEQKRSEGSSLISDLRGSWRAPKVQTDKIVDADVADFLSHAQYLQKDRDFWFDMYPGSSSAEAIYHRGFMKFKNLGPLEPVAYGMRRKTMEMEEV